MLWLCIHFPQLPLEVFTQTLPDEGPRAVTGGEGRRQCILACNTEARALGICTGMRVGAAHALGQVRIFERRPQLEAAVLERLAIWSGQFTSVISTAAPHALLLEIAGSLKLFGGVDALLERVRHGIGELGYACQMASAPTPLAAIWFARVAREIHIDDPRHLSGRIAGLPLRVLELNAAQFKSLRGMGLRKIGDLLRLPRGGLAYRIDRIVTEQLDRALGRAPDPRPRFELPAHFKSTLELTDAADNTQALVFIAHRQLLELAGFLKARCSGVQRFVWQLTHRHGPATSIRIGLLAPRRDPEHLMRLLQERLERTTLPAPVEAVTLEVDDVILVDEITEDLFSQAPTRHEVQRTSLVERLRARLGTDAITGLCMVPDHRPEYAWRTCTPGECGPDHVISHRPLWLLERPLPLGSTGGRPPLESGLRLRSGCERIEAGWWAGTDTARDYFMAEDALGSRFWVFKDLRCGRWYLHGVFE